MKIYYSFFCFNEHHDAVPLSLNNKREITDAGFRQWQPMCDFIAAAADNLHLEYIQEPRSVPASVVVLFADNADLVSTHTLDRLVANSNSSAEEKEARMRYCIAPVSDTDQPKDDEYWLMRMRPILVVGVEDIRDLFAERTPAFSGHDDPRQYLYKFKFDDRIKFWDSSIWHRYVPVSEPPHARTGDNLSDFFAENVQQTLAQIKTWYEMGLYDAYVSIANLELQTRAMLNSFICEIGDHGHDKVVTPFKFHSEAAMRREAENILNELCDAGIIARNTNPDSS